MANGIHPSPGSATSGGSSQRRPHRPAPVAPHRRNEESSTSSLSGASAHTPDHTPSHTPKSTPELPRHYPHEEPVFSTLTSNASTSSPYSSLKLGQHGVMDLDIAELQREEEEAERDDELTNLTHKQGREVGVREVVTSTTVVQVPFPVHIRASSDSTVLTRKNSASLPDLMQHASSLSPEELTTTNNIEDELKEVYNNQPMPHHSKHTRHLSLLTNEDRKLRKKRRTANYKQRSRSPPTYPPHPPFPHRSSLRMYIHLLTRAQIEMKRVRRRKGWR